MLVGLLVVVVDLVSKFLVTRQILLKFKFVENLGLPFGIVLPGFFNLLAVVVLFVVFLVLHQKYLKEDGNRIGFWLIAGGAVSNILDRLGDGKATDFINIGLSTLNLADLAIMMGIAALALSAKFKNQNVK